MYSGDQRIEFFNAFYDNLTLDEVLDIIQDHVDNRTPGFMSSINTQMMVNLDKDPLFKEAFDDSTIVLMDSQPLIWLARSNGLDVKEKLSGSDIIYPVSQYAADHGMSCYILGGAPGVPDMAAASLKLKYPHLEIVGTSSPPLGFMHDSDVLVEVANEVKEANPDIVFVCISSPNREVLASTILKDCGVPFCMCVGAAVDFVAGTTKRAPQWVSEHGLEWLYRVTQDPKRLFKRYFVESWHLLSIIARDKTETA